MISFKIKTKFLFVCSYLSSDFVVIIINRPGFQDAENPSVLIISKWIKATDAPCGPSDHSENILAQVKARKIDNI